MLCVRDRTDQGTCAWPDKLEQWRILKVTRVVEIESRGHVGVRPADDEQSY
jgi:hypothetical protein